jgi:CheY-like chemotaxis protein
MDNNNSKIVLVIDDEEFVTGALAKKLTGAGYKVLIQRNGEEGLAVALSEHPDLILLDVVMPKMDGLTMLSKLREDEWGKDVPAIILTNLESAEKVEESRRRGVYDYLVKTDWSLSDVLDKVNQALSSRT